MAWKALALDYQYSNQQLALDDRPEDMRLFEYSVLVNNLDDDVITPMRHYRYQTNKENNINFAWSRMNWGFWIQPDAVYGF